MQADIGHRFRLPVAFPDVCRNYVVLILPAAHPARRVDQEISQ
jgi:hypothetical protein